MLRTEMEGSQRETQLARILREQFCWDNGEAIGAIEASADYLDLASGDTLVRQGDRQDDVYFVLSGRLRALATDADGVARTLGEIGRGETIGELALFTGEPRSATVVALRDTTVARLGRGLIERTMARAPEVALGITRLVIERFRQVDNRRPQAAVPVTVCLLPLTAGVDAMRFARALRAQQPVTEGGIAVIGARDGTALRPLVELEQEHNAIYLVADPDDSTWTRYCLQHADDVMLLADATSDVALSQVERTLLAGPAPITIARQTLVLLHDASAQSPSGTARWLTPRGRPRHFHIRPALQADMARLARIVSGRAVGLVLAGGGARGFAHVGVYQALEQAGVAIDYVGGTSIGALMGTLMALDARGDMLERGVHEAFLQHPKGNITGDYNVLPLLSLIKGGRSRDSLKRAVRRHAGHDLDMEDTWKSFFAMASNFSTGSEDVLTGGSLVRNVMASFAIPGALPPVVIDGQLLFDGGTFNNFPVDVMAAQGVGKVIGVDLSSDLGHRVDTPTIPGTLALIRDRLRPRAAQRYRRVPTLPETMMMSSFVTSLSRQREQRKFADLLFRPPLPHMGLLDWHRFDEIVAAGRNHATAVLAALGEDGLRPYR